MDARGELTEMPLKLVISIAVAMFLSQCPDAVCENLGKGDVKGFGCTVSNLQRKAHR
jgi:hypothetical protein